MCPVFPISCHFCIDAVLQPIRMRGPWPLRPRSGAGSSAVFLRWGVGIRFVLRWMFPQPSGSHALQKLGVILPSSCAGCWDPNLLPSILPSLPQHPLLSWTPNFSAPQPSRYLQIPSLRPHSFSPSDPAPSPPHTTLGTTSRNPHQPQHTRGSVLPPPCLALAPSSAEGRRGTGDAQLG